MAARAPRFELPPDPLERFVAIWERIAPARAWWDSGDLLRHSALALVTIPGDPRDVADELLRAAAALQDAQPWYQRSGSGVLLATWLVRSGRSVAALHGEIERAKTLFREHWRFSGGNSEALAILVLADAAPDGAVSAAQVGRLAAIYAALKADHPLLTGKSDWPHCALLVLAPGEPAAVAARVEAHYVALHAGGASRGDRLQTAAFVLGPAPGSPEVLAARFHALLRAFTGAGLHMLADDYDELAHLALVDRPAAEVVEAVLRHRGRIAALTPRPSRQASFSLAASTAQLELARAARGTAGAADAAAQSRLLAVLCAQRALIAHAAAAAATTP
jgi:hypothetical protein